MTRELDPQLVEAVAKSAHAAWYAKSAGYYKAYAGHPAPTWEGDTEDQRCYYREQVTTIILAADRHRAPAVREAIANYRANVEANVQWGPGNNNILQRAEDASLRDLLTLLGAQEGDDA